MPEIVTMYGPGESITHCYGDAEITQQKLEETMGSIAQLIRSVLPEESQTFEMYDYILNKTKEYLKSRTINL